MRAPPRRTLRGGWSLYVLVGAVLWPAAGGALQTHPLRFAETGPIQLTDAPTVLHLFNDGADAVEGLEISATLGIGLEVDVEVDRGSGFEPLADAGDLSIEPDSGLLLSMTRPDGADPGTPGRIVARGISAGEARLARLDLTAGEPSAAPAVSAWSVVSTQAGLLPRGGGEVGRPIPLARGSTCAGVGRPETLLVNGDRSARLTVSCGTAGVQLVAPAYPPPGTYTGEMSVSGTPVAVVLRRTAAWWWPALAIMGGLLLALWTQGQLNRSWNVAQWLWLISLKRRAKKADGSFREATKQKLWQTYEIAPGISEKAGELQRDLREVTGGLRRVFRILPWPEGFRAHERKELRDGILELDRLVREWPLMPEAFSRAHEAYANAHETLVTWSPALQERADELFKPATPTSTELKARIAQVRALPEAIQLVERLAELDAYLDALEKSGVVFKHRLDREVLRRARQAELEARHLLTAGDAIGDPPGKGSVGGIADATEVLARVGPVVERGRMLARRLPRPGSKPAGPTGHKRQRAAPGGRGSLALSLGDAIGAMAKTPRFRGIHLTGAAAVLVTLLVTLWSGIAALYLGKAWGTWLDYAAAAAWGFGAASLIAPAMSWLQQLAARPQDAASEEA